ncbi:MAG: hypothetical protein IPM29_25925 [Planctomycetes bacterium]|nr:hypothetical protein [Planctomycetota bacterium]
MVRIQGLDEYDRLDALMRRLAGEHGLRLDVTGWTRKTYDVYLPTVHGKVGPLIARVESFATTNGEVVVFDDRAMEFAAAVGAGLEAEFGIAEAVVVRRPRPV